MTDRFKVADLTFLKDSVDFLSYKYKEDVPYSMSRHIKRRHTYRAPVYSGYDYAWFLENIARIPLIKKKLSLLLGFNVCDVSAFMLTAESESDMPQCIMYLTVLEANLFDWDVKIRESDNLIRNWDPLHYTPISLILKDAFGKVSKNITVHEDLFKYEISELTANRTRVIPNPYKTKLVYDVGFHIPIDMCGDNPELVYSRLRMQMDAQFQAIAENYIMQIRPDAPLDNTDSLNGYDILCDFKKAEHPGSYYFEAIFVLQRASYCGALFHGDIDELCFSSIVNLPVSDSVDAMEERSLSLYDTYFNEKYVVIPGLTNWEVLVSDSGEHLIKLDVKKFQRYRLQNGIFDQKKNNPPPALPPQISEKLYPDLTFIRKRFSKCPKNINVYCRKEKEKKETKLAYIIQISDFETFAATWNKMMFMLKDKPFIIRALQSPRITKAKFYYIAVYDA